VWGTLVGEMRDVRAASMVHFLPFRVGNAFG
jgi:hypothetical protein